MTMINVYHNDISHKRTLDSVLSVQRVLMSALLICVITPSVFAATNSNSQTTMNVKGKSHKIHTQLSSQSSQSSQVNIAAASTNAQNQADLTAPPERANQSAGNDVFAPPERADQAPTFQPFSTWDIQGLYGNSFHEPGVSNVIKKTITLENSAGWSWGSSYFFMDYLRSNQADNNAAEYYGEWYPSLSIVKVRNRAPRFPIISDVLITMGINAGSNSNGAAPLAFLPGITLDLKIPYFQFFSLGTYAYMDRGRQNGQGNGCHANTYQITPSWSLPFALGTASFRFDGFVDYIGSHGGCAYQIVSQPTVKLDLGNFKSKPNRLFAGVEWAYWRNKYGISGLNQTAPQGVIMWVF